MPCSVCDFLASETPPFDYDPKTGKHYKPSNRDNEYNDPLAPNHSVPNILKTEYIKQSQKLYSQFNQQLHPDIITKHKSTFKVGLYKRDNARGYEGDGVTLFWSLISIYKPTGATHREKLETLMMNAYKMFNKSNSP